MTRQNRIWIPEAPMVNLRRYHEVGVLSNRIGVEGWFTVELIHSRSGLVRRRLRFRNLITNGGLNYAISSSTSLTNMISHLAVGTGSKVPSVDDSSLVAEIARTNRTGGFSDETHTEGAGDDVVYHSRKIVRLFTENEANGNLTELGFYSAASGGVLWNRQLFRDELGQPTTITKTTDDQLRVYYEWRVYPPMADTIHEVTINGQAIEVTERACSVATHWIYMRDVYSSLVSTPQKFAVSSGGLTTRNGSPSGTGATDVSVFPYQNGSLVRDREAVWAPSVANHTIRRIAVAAITYNNNQFQFQLGLNPPIAKTDSERLIVQSRIVYGRYEP